MKAFLASCLLVVLVCALAEENERYAPRGRQQAAPGYPQNYRGVVRNQPEVASARSGHGYGGGYESSGDSLIGSGLGSILGSILKGLTGVGVKLGLNLNNEFYRVKQPYYGGGGYGGGHGGGYGGGQGGYGGGGHGGGY